MSKANFKPNGNATCLCGDWDTPLFYSDYDQNVTSTRDTLFEWTKWMWQNVGARGFRADAVKNLPYDFIGKLLDYLHTNAIDPSMFVGEFYDYNPASLKGWVDNVKNNMSAAAQAAINVSTFDFSLQGALRDACDAFGYDARTVFNSGVVDGAGGNGVNAVTFVNNHDFRLASQSVDNDRMLAYAYILTNNKVGTPSVYYTDYYDTSDARSLLNKNRLDKIIAVNKKYINNSANREYLNRFNTPFTSNYISGAAANSLIYQLSGGTAGCSSNKDAIVAINFSGQILKVDQQVNTGAGFHLAVGDTLVDMLGNSAYPYAVVNASGQIYMQVPARSYSVWVKSGLTRTPAITATGATAFCNGDSVQLSASASNACYSYQWQLNNINIEGATATTYYAKTAGNYRVQVSYDGVMPKYSTPISVTINSPIPVVTIISDTLTSSASSQYQWYYSLDSLSYFAISGETSQTLIATQTGYYYVELTDNGCSTLSHYTYVNLTGINSIDANTTFIIKPNPSNDGKFFVAVSDDVRESVDWKVYNLLGSCVYASKEQNFLSNKTKLIDISAQPSGLYYLQLTTNFGTKTVKLVKQ